jgi:S1-C subfamily serine protease
MNKFYLTLSALIVVAFLSGCATATNAIKSVNWETIDISETEFLDYLNSNKGSLDLIEGIWVEENQSYRIAIKKDKSNLDRDFVAFVLSSSRPGWKKGFKKIDISTAAQPGVYMLKYYDGGFDQSGATVVIKETMLFSFIFASQTYNEGRATFVKTYPKLGANISQKRNPRKSHKNKPSPDSKRSSSKSGSLPDAFGSGFYVTSNGYLLTNQHVVDEASQVFIYSGSQRLPAKVIKTDAANDLALLKVTGAFSSLPVSSSRRVKLGQTVFTVGFPNPDLQGKSPKLTKGEISSLSGALDDPKYFQISVPVQPGNSGGPLVDAYGNVIGVITAKLRASTALAKTGNLPENVNYAVKGTFVMGFLESVPEVAAEMLDPKPRRSREFTEVVNEAEKASVMILVYE